MDDREMVDKLGFDLGPRFMPNQHPLPAPRCRCSRPVIVEDMYGDWRCARCGRSPRIRVPELLSDSAPLL